MKEVLILVMILLSVVAYAYIFWVEIIEDFFLERKSKFSFPKHKDKFLIKQDNKFVWVKKS